MKQKILKKYHEEGDMIIVRSGSIMIVISGNEGDAAFRPAGKTRKSRVVSTLHI